MSYKLTTVIFFDKDNNPYKYRNIHFDETTNYFRDKSLYTLLQSKGAVTINIYDKSTKQFIIQLKKPVES